MALSEVGLQVNIYTHARDSCDNLQTNCSLVEFSDVGLQVNTQYRDSCDKLQTDCSLVEFSDVDYRLTRGIGTAVTGYKPTVDSWSFLTLDMQVNTPAKGVWTIVTGYKPPVASWLKNKTKQKKQF